LATPQTNAFQSAFVADLCAQMQVEMGPFKCSSITTSSISSSESRRLLETTSSEVIVKYAHHLHGIGYVLHWNSSLCIAPALLVAAVADAHTGDAITGAAVGALTAAVV
jgi:hypothetical protein